MHLFHFHREEEKEKERRKKIPIQIYLTTTGRPSPLLSSSSEQGGGGGKSRGGGSKVSSCVLHRPATPGEGTCVTCMEKKKALRERGEKDPGFCAHYSTKEGKRDGAPGLMTEERRGQN